jgi:NitT/TauT family transport system substrate-binding protein
LARASLGRPVFGLAVLGLAFLGLALAPAGAQTPVKFLLDFKIEGPAAPFLVALDKGYYKAENVDVTFEGGNGSIEPISKVAAGTFDMGFADINSLIRYRDQNPAAGVKAVFMVYNRAPFSIVARKSRGVTKPKDLEGKKLGAPIADAAFAQWKIFAKANNIDVSKVAIDNVGLAVREPMLAAGQVDAITGFAFSSFVNLKDRGVPVDDLVVLSMADYGVDLYGNAIIVNQKFAAEKPEVVRGFLKAFAKGLRETVRDPATAVASVIKRNDALKREVELERLRMAIRDNISTPEVKTRGYGAVDMIRFEKSIEQIAQGFEFKAKPKAADVFDASFLPADAERRAN